MAEKRLFVISTNLDIRYLIKFIYIYNISDKIIRYLIYFGNLDILYIFRYLIKDIRYLIKYIRYLIYYIRYLH